jgi:hypothetical protein
MALVGGNISCGNIYVCLLQIVNGTYFYMITSVFRGRDNVHGTATRYGQEIPGIESRWGRNFSHPPNLLNSGSRVIFGSKLTGAWL